MGLYRSNVRAWSKQFVNDKLLGKRVCNEIEAASSRQVTYTEEKLKEQLEHGWVELATEGVMVTLYHPRKGKMTVRVDK